MKKFLLLPVLVLLWGLGYVYWFYYNVYSDGSREGVLVKISRKGNVFKTHEAEILQPGFRSGDGVVKANTFKFSVRGDDLARQLEKAAGQTVKVHYVHYRRSLPWRGDNYDVDNAEIGQYVVTELISVSPSVSLSPQAPSVSGVPLLSGGSPIPVQK